MNRRRDVVVGAAAAVALGWSGGARSQGAYPTRAVKLIVPYPPGGSTDILARAFSEQLAKQLGQPVVIDNRPGAQTNIGTEAAARSTPDGYTVYFGTSSLATNPHFGPAPSIDVLKDLAPIGMIAGMSFVVAANPALPATDGASLIALARSRPGKVTIASASLETQVLTLNKRARIELMHVPYKGGAQAVTDYLTAVYGAFGAMMALYARTQDGLGQMVDTALCETAFSMMESAVPAYERTGDVPMRQGPRLMNSAPNSLYPSRDGNWVLIGANNDSIFIRLAQAMGRAELANDPRYATARSRGERVEEIDGIVTEWTTTLDADSLVQVLLAAGVPNARVNTIADIFEDQYFRAREMLIKVPHRTLGDLTVTGIVPKLSRTPGVVVEAGHELGEDTIDVLMRELGMDRAAADRLIAEGAVFGANAAA